MSLYTPAVARIQFRLPDGSTQTHSFAADAPLGEVYAWLAQLNLGFSQLSLSTSFPRLEIMFLIDDVMPNSSDLYG